MFCLWFKIYLSIVPRVKHCTLDTFHNKKSLGPPSRQKMNQGYFLRVFNVRALFFVELVRGVNFLVWPCLCACSFVLFVVRFIRCLLRGRACGCGFFRDWLPWCA